MQPPGFQITPDEIAGLLSTAKWILGAVFGGLGAAIGFLLHVSYRFGGHVVQLKEIAADMVSIKTNSDKVPVLDTRLAIVENVVGRHNSDIKGLLRGSNPAFNGGDKP